MCGFQVGDQVTLIRQADWKQRRKILFWKFWGRVKGAQFGVVYTVAALGIARAEILPDPSTGDLVVIRLVGDTDFHSHMLFRKVERKKDSLSIEAFLTIKPGFEEKDAFPVKKRERV